MPNTRLLNPNTGGYSFGIVPECKVGRIILPSGHIFLSKGRHQATGGSFGARHIWVAHEKEILRAGFDSEDMVPQFVATIIREGTALHYEGGNIRRERLIALRAKAGVAIIEQRGAFDNAFWTVITAYAGNKKHGSRIAAVLKA